MYKYIRNLRHKKIFSHILIWRVLGYCFRIVIAYLPFNFSINKILLRISLSECMRYLLLVTSKNGVINIIIFLTYMLKKQKKLCFLDVGSHIGIVTLPIAQIR